MLFPNTPPNKSFDRTARLRASQIPLLHYLEWFMLAAGQFQRWAAGHRFLQFTGQTFYRDVTHVVTGVNGFILTKLSFQKNSLHASVNQRDEKPSRRRAASVTHTALICSEESSNKFLPQM